MPVSPQDPWYQVAEVVRLIRSGDAQTRPELADATRLGRNVITQRIQAARDLHVIEPDGTGRSRGGRAADVWAFQPGIGSILVGLVGVHRFRVALTDLAGRILAESTVAWPHTQGTEPTLQRMAAEFDALLEDTRSPAPWGIGIGLPAPVDITTGQSADPVAATDPSLRWQSGVDVRSWFNRRYKLPTWVDAVANLSTLGAAVAPDAAADLIFVRMGTGIGGGLVSAGRLHRGATWLSGELAHVTVTPDSERICACGRFGCLDTFAGGWAIATDAEAAAADGRSPFLAGVAAERALTADDVADGARHGDPASVEITVRAAEALGQVLGRAATWFNPAEVVIGGSAIAHDELFLNVVVRTIELSALPKSAAALRVRSGHPRQQEAVVGAVRIVVDALLSPDLLAEWGPTGSPTRTPALAHRPTQL